MPEKQWWENFGRNIGILTKDEQRRLKDSTVAIAGIGGVGGLPAERLTRLGIGHIKIADPETFTNSDLNRQFGSSIKTLGKKKVEVVGEIMKEINPDLQLNMFPEGINQKNIEDFLDGVDLVIDAIEFFAFKERMLLYPKARERGIYVILSGATGFGSPLFVFSPNGMTMEEFFEVPSEKEKIESFQISAHKICPKLPEYIDQEIIQKMVKRELPGSTLSSICALAGSLLSTEVLLLLLKKRKPVIVPKCILLDLFRQELVKMDLSKNRNE
jgi:molybdopterin/thiamine biosynthesis adenylyltransferase